MFFHCATGSQTILIIIHLGIQSPLRLSISNCLIAGERRRNYNKNKIQSKAKFVQSGLKAEFIRKQEKQLKNMSD